MNQETILQNIKKIRELKNFKQDYMADGLGLALRAYTKIETGETALTFNRFFQIATILDVKPEELFGFDYKNIFNNCQNPYTVSGVNTNTHYSFDQNMYNELIISKNNQIKLLEERIYALKNIGLSE